MYEKRVNFDELLGKVITNVDQSEDSIIFYTNEGNYQMVHIQDCCENVTIEDVTGDWDDLIGSPILIATETTKEGDPKNNYDESSTWTFYNLATIKGYVTIRWYGTSNGYYSESVDLYKMS